MRFKPRQAAALRTRVGRPTAVLPRTTPIRTCRKHKVLPSVWYTTGLLKITRSCEKPCLPMVMRFHRKPIPRLSPTCCIRRFLMTNKPAASPIFSGPCAGLLRDCAAPMRWQRSALSSPRWLSERVGERRFCWAMTRSKGQQVVSGF